MENIKKYSEYTKTIETEVGTLELIYVGDEKLPQVWLNYKRIHVASQVLQLNNDSAVTDKVVKMVKAAAIHGVKIGG